MAIRNVGSGPVLAVIKERDDNGKFTSLDDFCARVDRSALNKRVLEALIKSGAMDTLPGTRHQKLQVLDRAIAGGQELQKAREAGQNSLFDMLGGGGPATSAPAMATTVFPAVEEGPDTKREYVAWEKELLGMPITEDPMMQMLMNAPHDPGRITLSQIGKQHIGTSVRLLGMLSHTKRLNTKKGDRCWSARLTTTRARSSSSPSPRPSTSTATCWSTTRSCRSPPRSISAAMRSS